MKKITTLLGILLLASPALWADNGARPGSTLGGPAPFFGPTGGGPATLLDESFDDITTLPGSGWVEQNNSDSPNLAFFQGNDVVFPAHTGAPTAYLGVNFNSTGGTVISNWMMTPEIDFSMAGDLRFWTRTVAGSTFPDGLEVRVSTSGASSDVGTSPTDVGDFTDLVLEINTALAVGGYPEDYMEFVVDLSGFAGSTGRVAFRYSVPTSAGPTGANSNYIGIDTVSIEEVIPPSNPLMIPTMSQTGTAALVLLLASLSMFFIRRR